MLGGIKIILDLTHYIKNMFEESRRRCPRDVYSSILLSGGRGEVLGSGKNIGVLGLFLARN